MARDFFTFDEVLKELQIDESELQQLIADGELTAIRESDELKFHWEEVRRIREEREESPTATLRSPDLNPEGGEADEEK